MAEELTQDELDVDVDLRERQQGSGPARDDGGPSGPLTYLFAYVYSTLYASPFTVPFSLWIGFVRADARVAMFPRIAEASFLEAFQAGVGFAWAFHYYPVLAGVSTVLLGGVVWYLLSVVFGPDGSETE